MVLTGTLFDYMESCMATKELKLLKSKGFMPVEANSVTDSYMPVNDSQPLLSQSEVKKTRGMQVIILYGGSQSDAFVFAKMLQYKFSTDLTEI